MPRIVLSKKSLAFELSGGTLCAVPVSEANALTEILGRNLSPRGDKDGGGKYGLDCRAGERTELWRRVCLRQSVASQRKRSTTKPIDPRAKDGRKSQIAAEVSMPGAPP